jgi:hypothetical protein
MQRFGLSLFIGLSLSLLACTNIAGLLSEGSALISTPPAAQAADDNTPPTPRPDEVVMRFTINVDATTCDYQLSKKVVYEDKDGNETPLQVGVGVGWVKLYNADGSQFSMYPFTYYVGTQSIFPSRYYEVNVPKGRIGMTAKGNIWDPLKTLDFSNPNLVVVELAEISQTNQNYDIDLKCNP